jgi:hypothetical protein
MAETQVKVGNIQSVSTELGIHPNTISEMDI